MEKKKKIALASGGTVLATAALIAGATTSFAEGETPAPSASSSASTQQGKGQHEEYSVTADEMKTVIDQVAAAYPNAEISDIHAGADNTFRVEIVENGTQTHLSVSADGTVSVDTNAKEGRGGKGKGGERGQRGEKPSTEQGSTTAPSDGASSAPSASSSATSNS